MKAGNGEKQDKVRGMVGVNGKEPAPELRTALDQALGTVQELGPTFASEHQSILDLRDRLDQSRLQLAVLGQFKRGKSTLLNALLGEELLPSAVVPVTAVPIFISWGPQRHAQALFRDGRTQDLVSDVPNELRVFLTRFVTEEANPANQLGVDRVMVEHPACLLEQGVTFIDTPGIGSTLQHSTDTAVSLLPACDAALFLLSADPPITQPELEFLHAVRSNVARVFFLMNKMDYFSPGERQQAIAFLKKVLNERAGLDGDVPVLGISARQGLEAKTAGAAALWRQSGMADLEDSLIRFLAQERARTLSLAVSRKAGTLIGEALLRLGLTEQALRLPLSEVERRLALFDANLEEAQRERVRAQDLLDGDRKRALEFLNQTTDSLRIRVMGELFREIEEAMASADDPHWVERAARERLEEVVPRLFSNAFAATTSVMNGHLEESLHAHQEKLGALIEVIRQAAAEAFDVPYTPASGREPMEIRHRPYWVTQSWTTTLNPLPVGGLLRHLLPKGLVARKVKQQLRDETDMLVSRNVENLRWALVQNVEDFFRRFASELDKEWGHTAHVIREAIDGARHQVSEQKGSTEGELARIGAMRERLQGTQAKLADVAASISEGRR